MNTGEVMRLLIAILVLCVCCLTLGFLKGAEAGHKTACESVKLEWVQDKCMKVTREAV